MTFSGSKKLWLCNDGMEILYHHAIFGGNQTTRVGVRVQSVLFFKLFFLFVNHADQIIGAGDLVALLQQKIALAFVG